MIRRLLPIGLVLAAYLVLGTAYALWTPLWQVPDEPAHFNYIRHFLVGPTYGFPKIEPGDYPFEQLEALKADRFPPGAPISGIQYEDHQPPAYYVLAVTVYPYSWADTLIRWVPDDPREEWSLHAYERNAAQNLRLLGVLLGAVTVLLTWRIAALLNTDDDILPVATAGFIAFLPMNLTMTAAVNNDPLAYAVMAAVLLVALKRLLGRISDRRFIIDGGLLFGLAILTKVSVMVPAAVVLAAVEIFRWWRCRRLGIEWTVATIVPTLGLGFLIGLPWMIRNARVYGAGDWFGLRAHDRVVDCVETGVHCQARTADWIAQKGLADLLLRFGEFTFKSFWGVFGWMAVFLTDVGGVPIYPALAAVSLAALVGLIAYLARLRRAEGVVAADQRWGLALLGLSLAVTVAGYVWYNLTFVQHQGRYLFPGLVPIALGFMLGLREVTQRIAKRIRGLSGLDRLGVGGDRRLEDGSQGMWDRWFEAGALYGFVVALAGLAWISLTRYIVPGLG